MKRPSGFLLLTAILLNGCSGGGSSSQEDPTASTPTLNAIPMSRVVTLDWNHTGAARYDLYRSTDPNCDIASIDSCAEGAVESGVASPHTVADLINGRHYSFWLKANHGGYSTLSQSGARPDQLATNGYVNSIVTHVNGTVYLGGGFDRIGASSGGGLPLSTKSVGTVPFAPVAGEVHAVESDGNGGWYIGGDFTHVGGIARSNIAHVQSDGTVSAWNPNANQPVLTLAVSGETVYVGGWFDQIGGATRRGLAAIYAAGVNVGNGAATAWDPNPDTGMVGVVAVSGDTVYVGGSFASIGGQARARIAAIDAEGEATPWNPGVSSPPTALVVTGDTVYVGGHFTNIGNQARNYIAALDATGNATNWNAEADGAIKALLVVGNTLYAGGYFLNIGGQARAHIAALDLSTGAANHWNPQANAPVYALATNGEVIFAGGFFTLIGGAPRSYLAGIDRSGVATAWRPDPNNWVDALAVSGSTIYAGGWFSGLGGETRGNLAAIDLDGSLTAWSPIADGHVGALAIDGDVVYVGGSFSSINSQSRKSLAMIDENGEPTPWNPSPGGMVHALLIDNNTLYVGGLFSTMSGQPRKSIAALTLHGDPSLVDGELSAWKPDVTGTVRALAVNGSTLYVGGNFSSLGAVSRNNIGAISTTTGAPTAWDPNANNGVFSLAIDPATFTLFAGGDFTAFTNTATAISTTRNYIAAIATGANTNNLLSWNPNPNSSVRALTLNADGSVLYAGGAFTSVTCTGGSPVTRNYMAALDTSTGNPTSWRRDATSNVDTLALAGAVLHAGGDFQGVNTRAAGGYGSLSLTGSVLAPCTGSGGIGGVLIGG